MMWLWLALGSMAAYGLWGFFLRLGTGSGWREVVFWSIITEALVIGAFLFPRNINPQPLKWGVLAGLCAALGLILTALALWKGRTSLPIPVGALYPAVTILLAFIFLKEPMNIQKISGLILTIVAIWLLSKG